MNASEIIEKCFPEWGPSYEECVKEYYDFLARGKYFPKENREAAHLLRCRGNDMLGLDSKFIEEIIKNNCAEAFVGRMVIAELWR